MSDAGVLKQFLAGASVDAEVFALRPDYRSSCWLSTGSSRARATRRVTRCWRRRPQPAPALGGGPAEQLPHVAAWREAYRAFGAKPKRTRNSLEALLRRAASGLPRVNRLTDCYNAGLGAAPDPARRGGPDPLRRPAAAGPRRRRRAVRHGG